LTLPEAALPALQPPPTSNRTSSPQDAPWSLCSVGGMAMWGATSGDPHPGYTCGGLGRDLSSPEGDVVYLLYY